MVISFEESSYSVFEGDRVDVCLLLVGETDIEILVDLNIEDGTTNSKSSLPPMQMLIQMHISLCPIILSR